MNAKKTYIWIRTFSLDRVSAIRLLASIDCAPAVTRAGAWHLPEAVKWTSPVKSCRITASELPSGRIEIRMEIDESNQLQGLRTLNDQILEADGGRVGSIRKSMVPTAKLVRLMGGTTFYRVRNQIEFVDLLAYSGITNENLENDVSEFPCLIQSAGLEVHRLTTVTEADLLIALGALTGDTYSPVKA